MLQEVFLIIVKPSKRAWSFNFLPVIQITKESDDDYQITQIMFVWLMWAIGVGFTEKHSDGYSET